MRCVNADLIEYANGDKSENVRICFMPGTMQGLALVSTDDGVTGDLVPFSQIRSIKNVVASEMIPRSKSSIERWW